MNQKNPGFSLLELMITIMISSILLTACLSIYNQITKSITTIQKIITADTKVMIFQDRLTKDLSGISCTWIIKKPKEQAPKNQQQALPAASKKNAADDPNQDNFFYVLQNNQNSELVFSFVTLNPLWSYTNSTARPVRVVYKLQDDATGTHHFKLLRKEDTLIDQDLNQEHKENLIKGSFYEICNSITTLKLEIGFIPMPQKEQQAPKEQPAAKEQATPKEQTNPSDKKMEWKWVNSWIYKKDEKNEKEQHPNLPGALKIIISFAQETNKPNKSYEFTCVIPKQTEKPQQAFKQMNNENAKSSTTLPSPLGATNASTSNTNNQGH